MKQPSYQALRLGCIAVTALLGAACTEGGITAPEVVAPSFQVNGDEVCNARITGGGQNLTIDGVTVSKGLTIHCDIALSNNLNIVWPAGHWHIQREQILFIECVDDPAYDPTPPDAPADTFRGRAIGRLGSADGSIVDFLFIDDGEPGTGDRAGLTVYAPNQGPGQVPAGSEVIVLQVNEDFIDTGNLQAHYDQPHNNGN